MSTSQAEGTTGLARSVRVTREALTVELSDGRSISVPLSWYPRLAAGSEREWESWELIGQGRGVHWPDLDEDISVSGLMAGRRSNESEKSLTAWRASRARTG